MDNRNNNKEVKNVETETSKERKIYTEDRETVKRKRRPREAEGEPQQRKRRPPETEGEPQQRKRRPSETEGEPQRRRSRPPEAEGEPQRRRSRPPEAEGEPQQRKRRPPEAEGEPQRRKRRPPEIEGEPQRRKRRPPEGELRHKKETTEKVLSRGQAEKEQQPPENIKKRRKDTMNGNGQHPKKPNIDRYDEAEENGKSARGCLFPVFLVLICLVVFVVSFAVLVIFMQDNSFSDLVSIIKGEEISADDNSEPATDENYIDTNNLFKKADEALYNTERNGVVSQISFGSNTIKIYDTDNESSVLLKFNSDTEILDENGLDISMSKVDEGDLIIFVCDENKTLLSLKENSDIEEATSLDVRINTSRKLITMGGNVYKYNDDTVFRYKDSVLSPRDITEFDVITVRAIDNKAWAVIMEKSHGTLKFTNYENISDVTFSVDGSEFTDIPKESTLNLTEGLHTITVQSPNCSDYTREFIIKKDTEAEMNLSSVQILRGSLIIDSSATGAALYVDGVERSFGNPMFLDYGSHKVTATRRGKTVSQYVTINKDETVLDIEFN